MSKAATVLKMVVVGDSQVGKTQMMLRFVDGFFSDTDLTTVGVDFKCKEVELNETGKFKLQIWDTAGQERFRVITETYYRKADGVAIVFDLTNSDSFNHVYSWIESVEQSSMSRPPTVLIGNKSDLPHLIEPSEAQDLARRLGVPLFYTSAKSGDGIDSAFLALADAARIAKMASQTDASISFANQIELNKRRRRKRRCK
jgi:small GTP-binding protein